MGGLDFISRIMEAITRVLEFIQAANKKVLLSLLAILGAAAFSILGYFWDDLSGGRDPSVNIEKIDKGGVDLAGYCTSYHYEDADEEFCTSNIDLNAACNWQYDRGDLRIAISDDKPRGGKCRDLEGKNVGGIKDMSGYCGVKFPGSVNVRAEVVNGKTWVCRTKINMDMACGWQYQDLLEAGKDDSGLWRCYKIVQSKG